MSKKENGLSYSAIFEILLYEESLTKSELTRKRLDPLSGYDEAYCLGAHRSIIKLWQVFKLYSKMPSDSVRDDIKLKKNR